MTNNIDNSYLDFIQDLKKKIVAAKSKAILSANRLMIEHYFDIGKEIVNKQEALGWGKSIVEQMSKDLIDEFGEKSGYSSSNLWRMRNFYLSYKDKLKLAQSVREISWGQNILIFEKCKDAKEQEYYIKNTIEYGWKRNVLLHHIKTNLLKRDKINTQINNFTTTLPSELSELAIDIVKSEYNLEFLNISNDVHEREVEKFKPEYAGKMNFYLNILNDKVKMAHENPAIGIILCTDKTGIEVEYALQNINQAMGVSTYTIKENLPDELKNALPTKEELEEKIKNHMGEH